MQFPWADPRVCKDIKQPIPKEFRHRLMQEKMMPGFQIRTTHCAHIVSLI